jgi:putative hydrolase of the HAD superfamily
MPMPDVHIVVLDLDDTLYKECDYVMSGVASVIKSCETLGMISREAADKPFDPDIVAGKIISGLCLHLGLPARLEVTLLWMYRLHEPTICLAPTVKTALATLRRNSTAIAIVTDGRAATQRLKLKALGLSDIPVFVSEEYDCGKPAHDMFEAVQRRWPNSSYVYVGDNLAKDFIAPNQMGWYTVGIRNDGRNIHTQDLSLVTADVARPKIWVSDFAEVPQILYGQEFILGSST